MSVELSNVSNVQIAQNEIRFTHAFNRNFRKLLENDIKLQDFYERILNQLNIKEFQSNGIPYSIGDFVWYRYNGDLFLLECINDTNTVPEIDDNGDFIATGWKDINSKLNILAYGVEDAIKTKIKSQLKAHEDDVSKHPFGMIQNEDHNRKNYIDNRILKKDLKNINTSRKNVMFPGKVVKLEKNSVVQDGYYRKYDNGVLEYDIVFKLADYNAVTDSSSRNAFGTESVLSANNMQFHSYRGINHNGNEKQENDKYFYNTSNMDIFKTTNGKTSRIGFSEQHNRNDMVNVYFAKIEFPQVFKDLNYMVFSNNMMCQGYKGQRNIIHPSSNDLTFCDKTAQSIVVMNIMFEDNNQMYMEGYNAENGGLVLNTFHCKIIGKWK